MYIKNVHIKTLNQHCPNVHIFISQFRSCCSPNRNLLTDWFLLVSLLTTTTQTLGRTWFDWLFSLPFKLTNTEVLICSRYIDADSQRYSYKNMLQNYAANLHKGVPAGAFHHKLNACSFHYTTNCAALFSLT